MRSEVIIPLEVGALVLEVEGSGSESSGRIKATWSDWATAGAAETAAKREESRGGQQEEDGDDVVFCEAEAIAKDSLFRRFQHHNRYQDSTLTCRYGDSPSFSSDLPPRNRRRREICNTTVTKEISRKKKQQSSKMIKRETLHSTFIQKWSHVCECSFSLLFTSPPHLFLLKVTNFLIIAQKSLDESKNIWWI